MERISLDLSDEILLAGDIAFISSLILLALLSWGASQSLPKNNSITMQWNTKGTPIWRAGLRFGLMFTPIIATLSGLFLSILAHSPKLGIARGLSFELLNLSIIRVIMAVAFVFAHLIHLSFVVKENK